MLPIPPSPVRALVKPPCLAAAFLAAESAGVPLDEVLHSERRGRDSAAARALAMYLAHVGLGQPLGRVAREFRRHRSTVAHACRRIEERREEPGCDRWIEGLEQRLRRHVSDVMEAEHG